MLISCQPEKNGHMDCPSCNLPMIAESFERHLVGAVTLDICYPCNAIWFDHLESAQLSPGSIIDLFKKIHAHRGDGRRVLSEDMACPTCARQLKLVNDLQRNGRFSYYRCSAGHGRLTSFFQFLREKQFIRSLTGAEIKELKAKVRRVRCSSCGAPIDIQLDTACNYCRSPISILDSDAVEKTLQALSANQRLRPHKDATVIQVSRDSPQASHAQGRAGVAGGGLFTSPIFQTTDDLVSTSISALVALLIDD